MPGVRKCHSFLMMVPVPLKHADSFVCIRTKLAPSVGISTEASRSLTMRGQLSEFCIAQFGDSVASFCNLYRPKRGVHNFLSPHWRIVAPKIRPGREAAKSGVNDCSNLSCFKPNKDSRELFENVANLFVARCRNARSGAFRRQQIQLVTKVADPPEARSIPGAREIKQSLSTAVLEQGTFCFDQTDMNKR